MGIESQGIASRRSPAQAEARQALPPQGRVDVELARVLSSRTFAPSRRQQRFLHYLVHHALNGNHAILKETVVAVEVFGRCADRFDPRADSIVRVEARRLRQRLLRYYAEEGADAPLRIELPVGSYVPLLQWRGPGPAAAEVTRKARDLVERGEHFLRQGSEAALRKALERFESAAAEAPGYAAAHKGAAQARMALVCAWHEPTVPWIDQARASIERALALEPADALAVLLMGILLHRHGHDWQAAEPWFRRAAEMAPDSALVRSGRGTYLMLAGRADEAEEELRQARQLDPLYLNARLFMAKLRVSQRRWDDADKELEALLDIAPHHFSGLQTRADVRRCRGLHDEALALYRALQQEFPGHAAGLLGEAQVRALQRREAECAQALEAARAMMGGRIPAYCVAVVRVNAGHHAQALSLLEESSSLRDPAFIFAGIEPAFDPLRSDARFEALFRRVRA